MQPEFHLRQTNVTCHSLLKSALQLPKGEKLQLHNSSPSLTLRSIPTLSPKVSSFSCHTPATPNMPPGFTHALPSKPVCSHVLFPLSGTSLPHDSLPWHRPLCLSRAICLCSAREQKVEVDVRLEVELTRLQKSRKLRPCFMYTIDIASRGFGARECLFSLNVGTF